MKFSHTQTNPNSEARPRIGVLRRSFLQVEKTTKKENVAILVRALSPPENVIRHGMIPVASVALEFLLLEAPWTATAGQLFMEARTRELKETTGSRRPRG